MKGFPGVLNTPGTLLDRSQTMKQIFKTCQKMKGPMGPMGLGPCYGPQGPWAQPLFDCVAVPSGGFFSAKKASNQTKCTCF